MKRLVFSYFVISIKKRRHVLGVPSTYEADFFQLISDAVAKIGDQTFSDFRKLHANSSLIKKASPHSDYDGDIHLPQDSRITFPMQIRPFDQADRPSREVYDFYDLLNRNYARLRSAT